MATRRNAVNRAFVPGYQHDVFVSYARVNDLPLAGAVDGWVTTLVNNLEILLASRLGRWSASLWMDHELAGNAPLTPAIVEALRQTAALVVVVSRAYLASRWCEREREEFFRVVRERVGAGSRVFVIEYDKVEKSELPGEFGDLLGYQFWVEEARGKPPRTLGMPTPRPEEQEYFTRLNNLSYELADELERLKGESKPNSLLPELPSGTPPGQAVYLAEVTDDLDDQREEVKTFLLQAGLRVFPKNWYSRDDTMAYQTAADADLNQCTLFVQLLSAVAGKKPPGWQLAFPAVQYERAKKSGKPVLQWRNREVNPAAVADANHRALLVGETVWATGIEEFKRAVVSEAQREPPHPPIPKGEDYIFVNSDCLDLKLAEEVGKRLARYDVQSQLPLQKGEQSLVRQDLEANLRDCDGLIVVYGATNAVWVRNQFRQGRKILAQREQPLRCVAVCFGPPSEKDDLGVILPNLKYLNFSDGIDDSGIEEFVRCLRS